MALVAYTRVSTGKQQVSGLGLEAQQAAIEQYAARVGEPILATFTEVESGAVRDRPQLAAALDLCRRRKAVLLIARLDRLSRSLAFIAQLLEAGVEVRAADVPEATFQRGIEQDLKLLRFDRAAYRWMPDADGWSYRMEAPSDGDVGFWSGGQFEPVP